MKAHTSPAARGTLRKSRVDAYTASNVMAARLILSRATGDDNGLAVQWAKLTLARVQQSAEAA